MAKRDLTMNDIIHERKSGSHQDKNKVFFNTPKDESVKMILPKSDFNLEGIEKNIAARKVYNENIFDFAERYATFRPYQGLLVRVFIRELNMVAGKLFTGDTPGFDKIQIPSSNVQGAVWRTVDNPFPFAAKCVVVNVPVHITIFKKGDILAIPQLQALPARRGDDSVIIYENFFVHPDSGFILPVQDLQSPDFGYAIIPTNIVQGFLND